MDKWTEAQIEEYNDLAAKFEYLAGMTRAEAEAKAMKLVEAKE
jgi:hypothetical protein